jgi:hypothetical protein
MKTFVQWVENAEGKRKIFVLVGPPSVGKSTWIKNTFHDEPYIINRDGIVDRVAGSLQMTYDDMFMFPASNSQVGDIHPKYGQVFPSPAFMTWQPLSYDKIVQANNQINATLRQRISRAVESGQDIVVDMTNMNAKARKSALEAVKGHEEVFHKVAVIFPFQGSEDVIKKVAAKRAKEVRDAGGSKTIPDSAFDRMFSSFEEVSPSEGFDDIVMYDNRELLSNLAQGL